MDADAKEGPMKNRIAVQLFLGFWAAVMTVESPAAQKPLADIYRQGTIKLVPAAAIDESAFPQGAFFQGPVDIKCDPKGNIYVCDFKAGQIFKFDAGGKFLKSIGRPGQGPGEFNMPFNIATTSDRLFVYDMQNNRLCALTLDGIFVKSVPLMMSEGRPEGMKSLPNGDILIGWEKVYFGNQEKPQEYSLRVFGPDLTLRKTIYSRDIWRNKYAHIGGFFTNIIQPFSPLVSWDVSSDGRIIIGYQKAYEIEIHDPVKGKTSSFTHSFEPIKVTDRDKEKFFGQMTYSSSQGGTEKGAPEPIVKATEFPKEKPPFFGLLVDAEGNILVYPHRKIREEEGKIFDAFTPAGAFIATVRLDGPEFMPRTAAVVKDGFWTFKYDPDGLTSIVKYRISN
jgi:hypothetical protein